MCMCKNTFLDSHFKSLGSELSKESFLHSCSICRWCFPILLIASASHIKCYHAHFVCILMQMVMWILLSISLHWPWLLWIIEKMTKIVWPHYKAEIHLTIVSSNRLWCFGACYSFLPDIHFCLWLSPRILICIFHLDVSNHCHNWCSMISLQLHDPIYGLLFQSTLCMQIGCNWWPLELVVHS